MISYLIVFEVCEEFGLNPQAFGGCAKRTPKYLLPKRLIMWIAHNCTHVPVSDIALYFNCSETAVENGLKAIDCDEKARGIAGKILGRIDAAVGDSIGDFSRLWRRYNTALRRDNLGFRHYCAPACSTHL